MEMARETATVMVKKAKTGQREIRPKILLRRPGMRKMNRERRARRRERRTKGMPYLKQLKHFR